MITGKTTAFIAAIFLVTICNQAEAKRSTHYVQDQFCGDRYCGQIESFKQPRKLKRTVTHKEKKKKAIKTAFLKIKRFPAHLPRALQKFAAPVGAICAKPINVGNNILQSFKERIASIVEPVRTGFVTIETASGKKAIVAEKAASKFVNFIRALETTGYKIKDIGGYSYRRIAGTRTLSKHAFGLAIDINQLHRDRVSVPMDRKEVSRFASMAGICSGGDWSNPDLGHFEICSPKRKKQNRHRYASI